VRQVSSTPFSSLLMATFVCIGFVLAIVMGRLGRSPFAWGLLGLVLGPIAMLLALVEVRNERPWWTRLVASGDPGSGPVDVLVGIDGSPESAATTAGLELLGDRVGRLTLVAVTDLDDSYAGREERVRLQGEPERQAEAVRAWLRKLDGPAQAKQTVDPELQLMAGRPATTLDTIAAEDGYDLLVVGARGTTGMSSVLLGSVATSLAARASVPVLIVGDQVVKGGAERKPRSVHQADPRP
jgi:nucleotide-binding universal stress UspA family protein